MPQASPLLLRTAYFYALTLLHIILNAIIKIKHKLHEYVHHNMFAAVCMYIKNWIWYIRIRIYFLSRTQDINSVSPGRIINIHVCKLNGIHSYVLHIYYNYIAVDGDNSTGTPYKTAIYSAHMYSLVHDYSIYRTYTACERI